jgi:hypothetical protein
VEESPFVSSEPAAIWYASPLKADAIDRVMSAPRLPIEGTPLELQALRLTLARLSIWIINQAMHPRPLSASDLRQVSDTYYAFMSAYVSSVGAPNAPPRLPSEWVESMHDWLSKTRQTPAPKGAPVKEFDRFTYPKLLAFYSLAFGRAPGATAEGPAHRFLSAYIGELYSTLRASTFEPPDLRERVLSRTTPPSAEAMRLRIRSFSEPSEEDQWMVETFFHLSHARLLEQGGSGHPTSH